MNSGKEGGGKSGVNRLLNPPAYLSLLPPPRYLPSRLAPSSPTPLSLAANLPSSAACQVTEVQPSRSPPLSPPPFPTLPVISLPPTPNPLRAIPPPQPPPHSFFHPLNHSHRASAVLLSRLIPLVLPLNSKVTQKMITELQ